MFCGVLLCIMREQLLCTPVPTHCATYVKAHLTYQFPSMNTFVSTRGHTLLLGTSFPLMRFVSHVGLLGSNMCAVNNGTVSIVSLRSLKIWENQCILEPPHSRISWFDIFYPAAKDLKWIYFLLFHCLALCVIHYCFRQYPVFSNHFGMWTPAQISPLEAGNIARTYKHIEMWHNSNEATVGA